MAASERVDGEAAWVLHRRPYRESSLLVDALSAAHGRIALVARGQRKGGGSRLEPFAPLRLSWVRRGELGTLRDSEAAGPAPRLQGDALWCGFYANELLIRLLARDDPNPELFAAYGELLGQLAQAVDVNALRRFEWILLDALGYGFDPTRTAQGAPVEAARAYCWRAGLGLVEARPGARDSCPGTALAALGEPGGDVAALKPLLAAALAEQLGERPLQSATMLRQLRGTALSPAPPE